MLCRLWLLVGSDRQTDRPTDRQCHLLSCPGQLKKAQSWNQKQNTTSEKSDSAIWNKSKLMNFNKIGCDPHKTGCAHRTAVAPRPLHFWTACQWQSWSSYMYLSETCTFYRVWKDLRSLRAAQQEGPVHYNIGCDPPHKAGCARTTAVAQHPLHLWKNFQQQICSPYMYLF